MKMHQAVALIKSRLLFVAVALFSLAACQDHHFVPIEKADKVKLPSNEPSAMAPGKVMEMLNAKQYAKEKAPAGPAQLLVDGVVDLAAEQKKKDFNGYTLYIIAWPKEIKGPPIAAARFNSPKFPLTFKLDSGDLMTGEPPAPGSMLIIEARLDKNSDPSIKTPGDVAGSTPDVAIGANNIKVLIDRDR
jgi:hypothetical protein